MQCDMKGEQCVHWGGTTGGFSCKARDVGKKGKGCRKRFSGTFEFAMPLWVFGSEVITQICLCKLSPWKFEGKKKPNPKESTSAQRDF